MMNLDPLVHAAACLPAPPEPANPSCRPVPISISEIPTVATKIDLDRTASIEPAVLAQLCAATQVSERRRLLPQALEYSLQVQVPADPPIAVPLVAAAALSPSRHLQRRQLLALILGSCFGMSLGMSAVWQLERRGTRPPRPAAAAPAAVAAAAPAAAAVPAVEPRVPGTEPLLSLERPVESILLQSQSAPACGAEARPCR
jgi:hypothetical protein